MTSVREVVQILNNVALSWEWLWFCDPEDDQQQQPQ